MIVWFKKKGLWLYANIIVDYNYNVITIVIPNPIMIIIRPMSRGGGGGDMFFPPTLLTNLNISVSGHDKHNNAPMYSRLFSSVSDYTNVF